MILDLITSIFFGIIVAIALFYFFIGFNRVTYRGPNSKDVKKKVFRDKATQNCYILEPHIYLCA